MMTREEKVKAVKSRLYSQGLTVKAWAEQHDYPVPEVYKVLSGERKGLYGRAFEIAQALGLWDTLDINRNG